MRGSNKTHATAMPAAGGPVVTFQSILVALGTFYAFAMAHEPSCANFMMANGLLSQGAATVAQFTLAVITAACLLLQGQLE
jgi:hypothetical protein